MNSRIKAVRKNAGLTQAIFADSLKLSKNYICQIEIGDKVPSDRTIRDICRIYKVDEEWLRTGTGTMSATLSRDEKIADLLSDALLDEEPSVKNRIITALASFDDEDWVWFGRLLDKLANKKTAD